MQAMIAKYHDDAREIVQVSDGEFIAENSRA